MQTYAGYLVWSALYYLQTNENLTLACGGCTITTRLSRIEMQINRQGSNHWPHPVFVIIVRGLIVQILL